MFGPELPLALAPLSTLAPTLDHPTAEVMPAGIQELAVVTEPLPAVGFGRQTAIWRTGLDGGLEMTLGANRQSDGAVAPLAGLAWSVIPGLWKVQGDVIPDAIPAGRAEGWRAWNVFELVTPWGTPRLAQGLVSGQPRVLAAFDISSGGGLVTSANVAWQGGDMSGWNAGVGARWRFYGDLAGVLTVHLDRATQASVGAGLGGRW
ncbi:MAG: hypothetical protein VKO21_05775 [Candidatus Sericytochromatia bacterium]|nr:hypothetical protein [Candidatus Sericytochromatia bacterium]